ncbi:MAG: hypothetical protein KDD53_07125 [Bdellovibrionales bacterium]|nr:hypothetical protein [Bdellovibrionales bacterium]
MKTQIRGLILEVPFKEKDRAKELGAWWDPDLKKWFVPAGKDTAPFRRWFSDKQHDSAPNLGVKNKSVNPVT